MKLRRRIIRYFILLILLMVVINLSVNYYLTQNVLDRSQDNIRKAFMQESAVNILEYYEEHNTLDSITAVQVRPQELTLQVQQRFWGGSQAAMSIPVAAIGGWDIVLADAANKIVLGDRTVSRLEPGYSLESNGKNIGTLWLVQKSNSFWELARKYLFIPLLFRSVLIALFSSLLGFGIAFILSEYLLCHIRELALAARKIANGELEHRVSIGAQDELGELAADFNRMADELEENRRTRRQLQADVVHELRTPLAVCQAVLDSLDNGVVPWDDKTLASLQEETGRMNRLVTDLHELNRADNQQLSLYKELFTVDNLIERIVESFEELARQSGVKFNVEIVSPVANLLLYADPDRVMQIFLNILHNALRHTEAGETIALQVRGEATGKAIFRITDTGEGITPEDLPYIFDRFFSGDRSRSRQRSGTGLGLAIAKEYALLHGGDIQVQSVLGQGTEFAVILPVEQE